MLLQRNDLMGGGFDWLLHLAQLLGIVGFIGGFACMLINLRAVWIGGARRWPAKTWSIVLTVSAFFVLWVAAAFHLFSLGVSY
jgi:hypothetical protein